MADTQPVDQVPHDAPDDQAKGSLALPGAQIEMVPAEVKHHQGHDRDNRQRQVIAGEQAPGGPGVFPMHELEKTVHDNLVLPITEEPKDDLFGELVERHDAQGEQGDAAVRGLKYRWQNAHSTVGRSFKRMRRKKQSNLARFRSSTTDPVNLALTISSSAPDLCRLSTASSARRLPQSGFRP